MRQTEGAMRLVASFAVWAACASAMAAEEPVAAPASAPSDAPSDAVQQALEAITAAPADVAAEAPAVEETVVVSPVDEAKRPYSLTASLTHAQLLVMDDDWANDHYLVATFSGSWELLPEWKLKVFGRTGVRQRFVTGRGSVKATDLRDLELGLSLPQEVSLAGLGLDRTADVGYRVALALPTSDTSLDMDLIMAPSAQASLTIPVVAGFSAGASARVQYRWHRYAEEPGPDGGTLPQLVSSVSAQIEYAVPEALVDGELSASTGVTQGWTKDYPALAGFDAVDGRSREHFWEYPFGFELGVSYTPARLAWLTGSASLEWGSNLIREGSFNLVPFGRDETEVSLTLSATY